MRRLPLLVLTSAALCAHAADLDLIPWPEKVEPGQGVFTLTRQTAIVAESAFTNEATLLQEALLAATGLSLQQRRGPADPGAIIRMLKTPAAVGGPEAYSLEVTRQQVTLGAAEPEGMFRAAQTLLQLLSAREVAAGGPCELPGVRIEDAPRFPWRGLMLDCSRTFQSIAYIYQTLDRMACYKLNVLHLHLTDDQGWRLEIKRYPELTRQGARFPAKYNEPPSHQGFYPQQQMRDLVAYAAARHITIVPEIEMPGHSLAALACYPRLSCTGGPFEIFPFFKGPGVTEAVYCAGNDSVFEFLDGVLAEVAAIFPGPYIHVGGDEVPKTAWKACPKCQARMKAEGLKNESELQSYFIRRAAKLVEMHGKRLLGWDEILEGGLAPNATVMSWRGMAGGLAAAQAGHDVVMSPTSHCYFDYTYAAIDSARVFAFDPVAGIPRNAAAHVLGLQANFWSHIDREPDLVDRQLYPRVLALAERGWSPDNRRAWISYQRRARAQLPRLKQLVIHYQTLDLAAPVAERSPKKTNNP